MTAERHKVILEQITVVGADTATLKLVVQDRKDGYDTCDCKIDLRAFFIKKVDERERSVATTTADHIGCNSNGTTIPIYLR